MQPDGLYPPASDLFPAPAASRAKSTLFCSALQAFHDQDLSRQIRILCYLLPLSPEPQAKPNCSEGPEHTWRLGSHVSTHVFLCLCYADTLPACCTPIAPPSSASPPASARAVGVPVSEVCLQLQGCFCLLLATSLPPPATPESFDAGRHSSTSMSSGGTQDEAQADHQEVFVK